MGVKFNRRMFVTTALSGVGGIVLGGPLRTLVQSGNPVEKSGETVSKKLFATTDIVDNIIINQRGSRYGAPVSRNDDYYKNNSCFMDRKQLDGLHRFLASLGVTRHQWIVDTMWNLYDNYPHGFDLLQEAARSAHKYGIEFYAEIKPFEGGAFGVLLPSTMPCPTGTGAYSDLRGIFPNMRRFEAQNPTLCLERKPGTFECNEPVSTIRLIKLDDRPTRVKAGHLSIYSSATNNHFEPYHGPVAFRETVEKRFRFPYWKRCRVLHFENLKFPEGHKYFLIKCSLTGDNGDFSNEKGNIIELAGICGNQLPHTLSTGPVRYENHEGFYSSELNRVVIPYLQSPEVKAEIDDRGKMEEHYRDCYAFGDYSTKDIITLDEVGYVSAVCGKPKYLAGQLHPVYPEVRQHWLELIQYCIDREVDGINIRTANHTLSPEPWDYGFNEPVMTEAQQKMDFVTISRINGNYYTRFLREARKLVKSHQKSLTVHLETELIIPDDRGKVSSLPWNFEWQWPVWVNEIADELEIRGSYGFRPWNFTKAIDIYGTAANAARKPIVLQGDFHGMSFDGPFDSVVEELKIVNNNEFLDGYVFYETANITRVNDEGELEGSPEAAELLKQYLSVKK